MTAGADGARVPQESLEPTTKRGGILLACSNHPSAEAAWCCGSCAGYFCEACVTCRPVGNTWVTPCPNCSELCLRVSQEKERTPFWQDLPSIVRYPLKGWGPLMWLGYSFLAWIAAHAFIAGLLLNFFLLAYCMLIVKESADGKTEPPDWPDFTNWWEIIGRALRGVACLVISLLPLGAYLYFSLKVFPIGDISNIRVWGPMLAIGLLPLILFTIAYFPMAFLIACLFDTVLPALNPLLIFRAIARVPMEYTLAIALCVGFALAGFLLSLPLRFVPILGGAGTAIISSYFQFIELHIIGRLAHLTEQKLNWHLV